MSFKEPNWRQASDFFDGNLNGCTGIDCGRCCGPQRQGIVQDGELPHYGGTEGLVQKGIEVRTEEIFDHGELITHFHHLSMCTAEGACKLPGTEKPLVCKLFPFDVREWRPLADGCPQILEIASDAENLQNILRIRTGLGRATTNALWVKAVEEKVAYIKDLKEALGLQSGDPRLQQIIDQTLIDRG